MTCTLSELCQLNGGCMGCCGYGFVSEDKIKEAISCNTQEFDQANPLTETQLVRFRDRAAPMDLRNGVCRNLIEKEDQLFCSLHPVRNNGLDLRKGHCDTNHLCQTARIFADWDREQQNEFIQFIKEKNLSNISYSLQMDKSLLLKEFESTQ